MAARIVQPLDLRRTKIDAATMKKIADLRFPQNGDEPLSTSAIAKRFGVTQKCVYQNLALYRKSLATPDARKGERR